MKLFGADFLAAKNNWLYPDTTMQWLIRALILFVLLFGFYTILQNVFAGLVFYFVMKGDATDLTPGSPGFVQFIRSYMLSIFPAAVVTFLIAIFAVRFGKPGRAGRLPLGRVKLGLLGWPVVVIGFLIFSFLVFQGVFAVMGVDPSAYAPSAGGLSDKKSLAGLVEKAMADMAKDPKLYALVTLSAVIGAPFVEELLFRGALFAAIAQSPVGRWGAVIITAALFGLVHAMTDGWPVVFSLFLMGITLGVLLLRFGSIWVTIACHAAWNGVQALALLAIGTS